MSRGVFPNVSHAALSGPRNNEVQTTVWFTFGPERRADDEGETVHQDSIRPQPRRARVVTDSPSNRDDGRAAGSGISPDRARALDGSGLHRPCRRIRSGPSSAVSTSVPSRSSSSVTPPLIGTSTPSRAERLPRPPAVQQESSWKKTVVCGSLNLGCAKWRRMAV